MTSEREAKVWMLAAGVMVVWACTMVGCSATLTNGAATPVNRPTSALVDPTWSDELTITWSNDTAVQPAWDQAMSSLEPIDSAALFAPSQPDVILLKPRPTLPNFDIGLSDLSIAQPLVSAKRLLVAAVTMLPPVPTPQWAVATSAAAHGDLADQPVAAATGLVQRLAFEQEGSGAAAASLGLAMLDRGVVMLPPWQNDPTPTPTVGAKMTADEAKFDAAGVVAIILGGMVLLFGGEAVVLWMIHRRRQAASAAIAAQPPSADDGEASIFRFPEPITAERDESYSRAA